MVVTTTDKMVAVIVTVRLERLPHLPIDHKGRVVVQSITPIVLQHERQELRLFAAANRVMPVISTVMATA